MTANELLQASASLIEDALKACLPCVEARPPELAQALAWAVSGGGKRLRPRLCLASALAVGGTIEEALFPACAIELLHSYTLVHDDLPAMDDDRVRRGKPSVWAKFGETLAILAGDALQARAFQVAAKTPHRPDRAMAILAEAAFGVVCGQVEDLRTGETDRARLDFVFRHKTADLFEAAARMGAVAAEASPQAEETLALFARNFGRAFQFADDLDAAEQETSFSCLSVMSRAEAQGARDEALDLAARQLEILSGDVSALRAFLALIPG